MRPRATRPGRRRRGLTSLALIAGLIVPLTAATPAIAALDNGLSAPNDLVFDHQVTGRTSPPKILVVTATGTDPTTITTIGLSGGQVGDFAIVSDTCTGAVLDPGETCAVGATFTPSTTGAPLTRLTIHADTAAGFIEPALTGIGVIAAFVPAKLELGSHALGSSSSGVLTLTNGLDAQSIGSFSLFWPNSGTNPFSIRPASGCTSITTIAALGTCDLTIDFVPTIAGDYYASLQSTVGIQQLEDAGIYGTGMPASGVAWGAAHVVRSASWTTGSGLARTVNGTTTYLHAAFATDYIGGKYANDSSPHVGVYYRRSSNGGLTWTSSVRMNPTTTNAARVAIGSAGARVYAAYVTQTKWVKYSKTAPRVLYLRTNTNHGTGAWGTSHRLTSLTGRVDYPTVAASGNRVYVAYTDAATGSIRVAVSLNGGSTFTTRILGTTYHSVSDGRAGLPSVAAYGPLVVVAWSNGAAIYARVSKDSGATWVRTTMTYEATGYSAASASSGRLAVAWPTATGLAVRTWTPSSWGPIVPVAPPVVDGTYTWFDTAAIALRGSTQVGVAWAGCRADCSTSSPTMDLVYSESTDGGATFTHPQQIVDGTVGGPVYPANFSPTIVWGSATQRYVMHAAETIGETYTVQIRTGTGTP